MSTRNIFCEEGARSELKAVENTLVTRYSTNSNNSKSQSKNIKDRRCGGVYRWTRFQRHDSTTNGVTIRRGFPNRGVLALCIWDQDRGREAAQNEAKANCATESLCLQQGTVAVRSRFTPHHIVRALGANRRLKDSRYLSANVHDTNGHILPRSSNQASKSFHVRSSYNPFRLCGHALAAGVQQFVGASSAAAVFLTARRKRALICLPQGNMSARDHPPTAEVAVDPLLRLAGATSAAWIRRWRCWQRWLLNRVPPSGG